MTAPRTAPFGTWRSPITTEALAANAVRLGGAALDGSRAWWCEGRPAEGGRNVLVHCAAGMSRSVSVMAALLCEQGLGVPEALERIALAKARAVAGWAADQQGRLGTPRRLSSRRRPFP